MEKNNNINIAEILKDCPKGMKLYSPLFGYVTFYGSDPICSAPIKVKYNQNNCANFFETGLYYNRENAECLLFPSSEMRDWSKFFKRGDVVITNGGGMTAIFDGWANDTYTEFTTTINLYFNGNTGKEEVGDTLLFRKATEEERKQFIEKAERAFNGKYNPESLQVEPVKPTCPFKPFDKVLVRNYDDTVWSANYFSHYKDNTSDYNEVWQEEYINGKKTERFSL